MSLQRPDHLQTRPFLKHRFGEDAQLISVTTTLNDFGETSTSETTIDICCATAPPSNGDPRVRRITEGGVPLEALRLFWMEEEPRAAGRDETAGDIIVFNSERWRVTEVQRWGGFNEVLATRLENQ